MWCGYGGQCGEEGYSCGENMRILFNMAHPGQIHLFKNAIWALEKRGHDCKITTVDKDVSLYLLGAYGFEYDVVGSAKPSLFSKATELLKIEYNLYRIARLFKPDILVGGVGNAYVAHVGKIIRKPSIVFDDTEHAKIEHTITDPFASVICTPSCYRLDLGKKQVRYDGYHELAYLHPDYFTPNPEILSELGLAEGDPFIILRFVSWEASHDKGHRTLTLEDKFTAVNKLKEHGRVLITSENELPSDLEEYRITVSPDKIHHLLYYATLLYGDSATMASECAVLGTHSIFCDYAGRGYTDEEEELYDLVYNFYDENTMGKESLKKALELLQDPDLKEKGRQKRDILLADKIDVTKFMVEFVENYSKN